MKKRMFFLLVVSLVGIAFAQANWPPELTMEAVVTTQSGINTIAIGEEFVLSAFVTNRSARDYLFKRRQFAWPEDGWRYYDSHGAEIKAMVFSIVTPERVGVYGVDDLLLVEPGETVRLSTIRVIVERDETDLDSSLHYRLDVVPEDGRDRPFRVGNPPIFSVEFHYQTFGNDRRRAQEWSDVGEFVSGELSSNRVELRIETAMDN